MARAVLLGCLLAIGLAFGAEAQSVPQYKDYPAKLFKGARAAVDVSPPDAWNYRAVLRRGAKQPINFAGRYVFTSWGVGRGCATGAAIDVSTGRVTFFPHNACFWREKDPPFLKKTGSRLFISTGNLGEDGPRGAHYFDFTGREFRYLMSNPFEDDLAPMANGPTIDQRPEAEEASSEGESSVQQSKNGEISASDPLKTIIEVAKLISNGEIPSWNDPQFSVVVRPYITEELLGTIQSGGERAVETGENVWDAEIFTGAAGIVRAKLFSASVTSRREEIATANVSIGTSDTEEEPTAGVKYEYDLILEKGHWKIDDIRILEEWAKDQKSLKETFAEVQRVARIQPAAGDVTPSDPYGIKEGFEKSPIYRLMICYAYQTDIYLQKIQRESDKKAAEINANADEFFVAAIMYLGGYSLIGMEVATQCKSKMESFEIKEYKSAEYARVREFSERTFVAGMLELDNRFEKACVEGGLPSVDANFVKIGCEIMRQSNGRVRSAFQ